MKAGWAKNKLGDVLAVLRNGVNCKQDKDGQGERISRIESIADATFNPERVGYAELTATEKERYRLLSGDILFSHINSAIHVGKTAIFDSDEEVYHGVNLLLMRPKPEVVPAYLNYALKLLFQSGYWKRTCKQSVNQASVNQQDISKVEIQYPHSIAEQHRIVAILDEAFDGIATAKANAEKNLQNARALFESHLQSVFTERGEGWVEKRLGEVCAITSTLVDPRKEGFIDLTHVGAGNIESQTGVFVELKTAREEGLISGKFLFDESMVLYSKIRPYLMKVARPDFNGLCSADMYPLTPKPSEITRDYLFHLLLSKPFTDYAVLGSARAGMPKVNREHLFAFRTWLPGVDKQMKLSTQLDTLHEETQRLESLYQQKLTALDDLKKSLLHQAFSGQL